jgi:hypothetical protein
LTNKEFEKYLKEVENSEFEKIAVNVIKNGGTKSKSVKEISATSRIMKEKIDI